MKYIKKYYSLDFLNKPDSMKATFFDEMNPFNQNQKESGKNLPNYFKIGTLKIKIW